MAVGSPHHYPTLIPGMKPSSWGLKAGAPRTEPSYWPQLPSKEERQRNSLGEVCHPPLKWEAEQFTQKHSWLGSDLLHQITHSLYQLDAHGTSAP